MRFAVLVSGSGTNLQAILDRMPFDGVDAELALVVSDKPRAAGLARARAAGIATAVVPWEGDRDAFTARLCDVLTDAGVEAVVLAGFMRILGPEAVRRFPDRIVNIHPSLLPSFPGARAVDDALAHGVAVSGVTVHFVDEQVDHGPIITQVTVPVEPDDTVETLHARIQALEHVVYPEVVVDLVAGRLRVEGRHVRRDPR